MPGGRKIVFKTVCYSICVVLLAVLLITLTYYYKRENFSIIIPNAYYRSAQLDAADLSRLITQKRLKSIINLRQARPDQRWYRRETMISAVYGIKHYDFPMQAYVMPNSNELRQLVNLLLTVPTPVLIHCEGGADRTGLAASIVLILNNYPLATAKQQVSLRHLVISKKSVGHLVLPLYQTWLEQRNLKSSRENFLIWLNQINF